MLAMSMKYFSDFGRYDWRFEVVPDRSLTEHSSRDPKVIEMIDAAVSENIKGACEPEMLGVSIIKREEHKQFKEDCAALRLEAQWPAKWPRAQGVDAHLVALFVWPRIAQPSGLEAGGTGGPPVVACPG